MIPELFSLNENKTWCSTFGGERARSVTLAGLKVESEPYHLNGRWYNVFRRAIVDIELDGVPYTLVCEPYALPVVIDGLRIEADLVQAAAGGLHNVPFEGDVRFAALDASLPWVPKDMTFPMNEYRWRASNYQHTWNGFVHVIERTDPPEVYYHRGEDYGAFPNRIPFFAMVDGIVEAYPPVGGDGESNLMTIRGKEISCLYGHADAIDILPRIIGDSIVRGDTLALTGGTWAGHSGISDPHLHIHLMRTIGGELFNSYPFFSELYHRKYPDEIQAIAGGFRFTRAGDLLTLSGARSLAPENGPLDFLWTFTDGTQARGMEVTQRYAKPGTFTEQLTVTDENGHTGHDFVIVMVSDDSVSALPTAHINHYPTRGLKPGQAAEFLCSSGMPDAVISFGDGDSHPYADRCTHTYKAPGYYTVTLRGHTAQGCEGILKIGVLVEVGNQGRPEKQACRTWQIQAGI